MKVIGYIATSIAVITYSTIINGWALLTLWEWFIVPTFNLTLLNLPTAIVLSYVVSHLTHQVPKDTKEKPFSEKILMGFILGTVKPLFALLFGFVVVQFM